MLYVLFCEDKPDSEALRLANRDAHLAYIGTQAACIRNAGPMLSDDGEHMVGSLLIIEAADIDAARTLHHDDPYTKAGLWGNVVIRPYRQVQPKP